MLLDMLDIPAAYGIIGSLTAIGVGIKLLLGSIYRRDIRNARSIEHTKKRWMTRMKRNFEKTFGDGLSRDAELFVENEMNRRHVCGISLKTMDDMVDQLPLIIITATIAFDFWFVNQGNMSTDLLSFTLYGATMCMAIHTFNMLVNNQGMESRLRILLTQYFSNEKLPLILMNQYADEKLIGKKDGYNPNSLVAAAVSDENEKSNEMSPKARRKRLKAEKLRLKRLIKQQKRDERHKRQETRKLMREQALKIEYEEKMKKLQEKYKLETDNTTASEAVSMTLATSGVELGEEVTNIMRESASPKTDNIAATAEQADDRDKKKDILNQTLKEAFPENRASKDDEKLIEEVLKEYLFR